MSNTVYQMVIDRIVKLLENGVAPWRKTWQAADTPRNLITKIPYKGVNPWILLACGMPSPYWLTWKQVMGLKGTVKKEESKNYQVIFFWKMIDDKRAEKNEDGTYRKFPLLLYYRVYNLSQVELPQEAMDRLVPKKEEKVINKLEACEAIVENYKDKPEIKFGGDRAYYACLFDRVQMPLHEDFESDEEYYSTLFHELAHSTGSEKRLARFKATDSHIFGSDKYSKEELVAEMTASFLCAETGIENQVIENQAAYLQSWIKRIKEEDKNFLISAASRAQKAADYILQRNTEEDKEEK